MSKGRQATNREIARIGTTQFWKTVDEIERVFDNSRRGGKHGR